MSPISDDSLEENLAQGDTSNRHKTRALLCQSSLSTGEFSRGRLPSFSNRASVRPYTEPDLPALCSSQETPSNQIPTEGLAGSP